MKNFTYLEWAQAQKNYKKRIAGPNGEVSYLSWNIVFASNSAMNYIL